MGLGTQITGIRRPGILQGEMIYAKKANAANIKASSSCDIYHAEMFGPQHINNALHFEKI